MRTDSITSQNRIQKTWLALTVAGAFRPFFIQHVERSTRYLKIGTHGSVVRGCGVGPVGVSPRARDINVKP